MAFSKRYKSRRNTMTSRKKKNRTKKNNRNMKNDKKNIIKLRKIYYTKFNQVSA